MKNKPFIKGSIFNFYLMMFYIFLLVGLIIIGTIMLFVSKEYYESEIAENYKRHTESLSVLLQSNSGDDFAEMKSVLQHDTTFYDMYSVILDCEGNVAMTLDVNTTFIGKSFPVEKLPVSDLKGVFTTDTVNGFFEEKMCCYVDMFFPKNSETPMYIVVYGSRDDIKDFNTMLYLVYSASSLFIMLFFMFVALKQMKSLIKPISDITEAARRYSQGDFSTRINVKSSGEIAELATVMNEMADSIDRNEKSRLAFIANVSHELRTPMTSIGGFVDAILSGTIPEENQKHYLMIVSDEIRRLSRLVRSMLYLSKYESHEMEINCSEFDLHDLVINTVFLFENQLNKKKADVQGLDFEKVIMHADKDLIQQVIYNLTENAVKFVDEGGIISYSVSKSNKGLNIAIRNTGEGIKEKDISRIFEKFYKTDESRGKDKTGVGLGLSIVRSIIALHNGTIRVSSVVGEYTQFDIELPTSQKTHK